MPRRIVEVRDLPDISGLPTRAYSPQAETRPPGHCELNQSPFWPWLSNLLPLTGEY